MAKKDHLADARRKKQERDEKVKTISSLKQALGKIEELEAELEAVEALEESEGSRIILPRAKGEGGEAVAIACATDWHLGSVITRDSVGGLNEFDAKIGVKRVETFFQRVVRFTDKERQDIPINELVLFLGGDMIDGSLHLDSIQSQDITGPIDQAILAQELIEGGINFLLNHGRYKRITVVCHDGNHGRLTQRQHWASRKGNALEYLMYYQLARLVPEVNWVIAKSLLTHIDIFGQKVRFHHGDTISFGGINGPFTYINRALSFWDTNHGQARYTVQGHLHSFIPTWRWLVNGSLAGYNAYAESLKGEFQPPIQSFFLFDKKRGPTVRIPIILT